MNIGAVFHQQTPHQQFQAICKEIARQIQNEINAIDPGKNYKLVPLPKNFTGTFDFETEMVDKLHEEWNIPQRWVQPLEAKMDELYVVMSDDKRVAAENADIFDMHARKLVTNAVHTHHDHAPDRRKYVQSSTSDLATRYTPSRAPRSYTHSLQHPSSSAASSVSSEQSDTTQYQPRLSYMHMLPHNNHHQNNEDVRSQQSNRSNRSKNSNHSRHSSHSSHSNHSNRSKHSHHSHHSNHSNHSQYSHGHKNQQHS
mmetsp:Transcript_53242/g.85016  ORF Transcript_53242/g.85016 Transcript_53242/m.85016 type:complete len:255 (-) Transcript_53242:12-776(-)